MKILGIILAVLMLSGSALIGVIGSNKARDLGNQIETLTGKMSDAEKQQLGKAMGESVPSAGRLKFGGIIGILAGLAAVALLIISFVRKPAVKVAAAAAVGLAVVAIIIYPSVKTGPMDGMAPRTQAIVAAVLAVIGAVGALLASRRTA